MPASESEWKHLQDVDRSIGQMRERLALQRRRIIELQKSGYSAVGCITLLRELENALRLMQSRRETIVRRFKRREQLHGAQTSAAPRR